MIIHGIWTALVTPMRGDGEVDMEAFRKLLDRQATAGVAGVVIAGTTGEGPTLTVGEKLTLMRAARAHLPRHVGVMAGTGGSSTDQVVELSRLALDSGADALLISTPPYSRPTKAGLVRHFAAVGEGLSPARREEKPICLYHVPGRTAQSLSVDEICGLVDVAPIGAIKEASGCLKLMSELAARCPATLLSGDDPTVLPSLSVGARGAVSVLTNLMPEALMAVQRAFERGDRHAALAWHQALIPLTQALAAETNPGPIKYLLAREGLGEDVLRAPLAAVAPEHRRAIEEALAATRDMVAALAESNA